MPAEAVEYTLKGVEAPVTPVSSINGNWALYGVPREGETLTKAPKECTHDGDDKPLDFGAEVAMSCCMNGSISQTNLNARTNEDNDEGFCSGLPTVGDSGLGSLTKGPTDDEDQNIEFIKSIRGLAMCTSKTNMVYGEFCGSFDDDGAFEGDCNKCGKVTQKDLSTQKCFKASDAPPAWGDSRQWFVMAKGCGCDVGANSASALIMGVAATLTVAALF
jgi:hypothetical protein